MQNSEYKGDFRNDQVDGLGIYTDPEGNKF